ncbi:MAG: hypothetical protein V7717_04905 [Porticoccaceae bacterium]
MKRLYEHPDDFEATITILTTEEGGRETPPFNGIRWDFQYKENNPEGEIYMIWPEFIDENNDAIEKGIPLTGTLKARMHIVNQEMKNIVHVPRMQVGTEFYSVEGPKKVAKGVITKLTGLLQ